MSIIERLSIISNFNSTMVRLKEYKGAELAAKIAFQFHYGTIKSALHRLFVCTGILFQFHYGTIKSITTI